MAFSAAALPTLPAVGRFHRDQSLHLFGPLFGNREGERANLGRALDPLPREYRHDGLEPFSPLLRPKIEWAMWPKAK